MNIGDVVRLTKKAKRIRLLQGYDPEFVGTIIKIYYDNNKKLMLVQVTNSCCTISFLQEELENV